MKPLSKGHAAKLRSEPKAAAVSVSGGPADIDKTGHLRSKPTLRLGKFEKHTYLADAVGSIVIRNLTPAQVSDYDEWLARKQRRLSQ